MMAVVILYSLLNVALRVLPIVLDSGIQIWNGVEIDQMVKDGEISYPGPLRVKEQEFGRRKRSIQEGLSLVNITLTDGLSFQMTIEGLVSIGLVQLPALCLAVFGIVQAFQTEGFSKRAAKDSVHASVLMFLPFFLVEIVSCFQFFCSSVFSSCLGFICGKCTQKCVKKFDFLHFLGKKDPSGKAKLLCLDAAKVFFGSCIQLCLQIVLLQYSFVGKPSQLLSILSSFLLITKTSFEVLTYQRREETTEDTGMKVVLIQMMKTIWEFIKYFPVLGLSLLFNLGTLTLSIILLGWYSTLIIVLIILCTLLTTWVSSLSRVKKITEKYQMTHQATNIANEEKTGHTKLTNLLMSYTNIFIISRPVENHTHSNINSMFLLQPLHFLINSVCLSVYLGLGNTFFYPEFRPYYCQWERGCPVIQEHFSLVVVIFLCAGFLNIFLCFTNSSCKVSIREITDKDVQMISLEPDPVILLQMIEIKNEDI
eukprot:GFUD01086900.1.p1 GENE.GFUD01086900.1~~GFUD01086900.1.p1  ORF type:complete len:481 (+),score=87.55 GFUD01086900.1:40-1482(+)